MDNLKLREELTRDEGLRLKPYRDTVGKLTIGIGRNLDDLGISQLEAEFLLMSDILRVERELDKYVCWWRCMSENRQRVLANMAFNMGVGPSEENPTGRLLTFKRTLEAMKQGRYLDAAEAMGYSKWAAQVGVRATRLIQMMREG